MWQPGRSRQMTKQDIIFNQIKTSNMNDQLINERLEVISRIAGGINEQAMEEIKRLLRLQYLDGQMEGIEIAKKLLV